MKKRVSRKPQRKCAYCKFYEFSTTLGSPDKNVFHCRWGFTLDPDSPNDCYDLGEYNLKCIAKQKYQSLKNLNYEKEF